MKCFPFTRPGIMFAELRIVPEVETSDPVHQNKNPDSVSRCRFVYAYIKEKKQCKGVLYLTTSHYGWDMLPEETLNIILTELPIRMSEEEILTYTWEEKCDIATKNFPGSRGTYHLQQKVATYCNSAFPFDSLGVLTINNKTHSLDTAVDSIENELLL